MSAGLRVGIMGAGRMAQGFDAPGNGPVLSLAHAIRNTPGLTLGGFYDHAPDRAAGAEARWDCAPSPRDRNAWLDTGWDIIAIATPDAQHAADLRDAIARAPRAILVEKPVALDPEEAHALLDAARKNRVPVLTDFPRRYHSATTAVARSIADGTLGAPLAATFIYSGDAAHSAVHMIDLLHGWWGHWNIAQTTRNGPAQTIALQRDRQTLSVCFIALPADGHYVWDMAVYCEGGRIRLADSPETFDLSLTAPHPRYTEFTVLHPVQAADMESEPLLERVMAGLLSIANDAEAGARQLAYEASAQKFNGAVLKTLTDRTQSAECADRRQATQCT